MASSKKSNTHGRESKPRTNFHQKKLRRQQIFMTVVGLVLVLSMVLALTMK